MKELIDGTVLKPGETFSPQRRPWASAPPRTASPKGFVVADGIFKEDLRRRRLADRRRRPSTPTFFAGLEDVEHKPHSFYIDRYPDGREATVAWPTVDLKFTQQHAVRRPHRQAGVTPSTPSTQGA